MNVSYQLVKPFKQNVARNFAENSSDKAFLDFVQHHDPLQSRKVSADWVGAMIKWSKRIEHAEPSDLSPLIIQGDKDKAVDFKFNLEVLRQKFSSPQIEMISGARHHLVNESSEYLQQMFALLDQWVESDRI